jgi:hypothetical protein
MGANSATALQRLERWGDPNDRLTATDRPSLGVARRSGDTDPTPLGRLLVPSDPHGVSTPSGHTRGRASRAGLRRTGAPLALSLSYRGPSQHPRTVPRTRRPARRTMLPLMGSLASRHIQDNGPAFHGAPGPAACHVRGLGTPIAASTVVPPDALRRRSVLGFTLQGLLLATIGTPSGAPCPLGVDHVDSPHPHGERADAAAFRALIPPRARSAIPDPEGPGAPMPSWACTLQSVLPPRPSPPLRFAGDPFARVGRFDVPARLRHKVSRLEEIGSPLSGSPALMGFITFRLSRHRGDRGGGRAHCFTSRLARVASGADRSEPPRTPTRPRLSPRPGAAVHR